MARNKMNEVEKRTLLDKALVLVNRARAAFDMEPLDELPKGNKSEPASCPLAVALDHGWQVGDSDVEGLQPRERKVLRKVWADDLPEHAVSDDDPDYTPDWVELPDTLQVFVDHFDSDEFPELIER